MKTAKTLLPELIQSCWYGQSRWALLLLPFSWIFALIAASRRWAYRTGLFNVAHAAVPVVVVGNISVGGTGKTPVVAWLAARLRDSGYSPAIVSRGYGGQVSSEPRLLDAFSTPAEVGDEPVLLQKITGCPVIVCGDRAAAVERAAAEGVNVVISDDGLQHYGMHRVAEIAVVDGQRGFGNGYLMPAGPLREPVSRLDAADAVLVNHGSGDIPGFEFTLRQTGAIRLGDSALCDLNEFAGSEVWGLAGIGNPQRFYTQLREHGLLVREVSVPDHGKVDIEALLKQRDMPVFMTAKDAVKYSASDKQQLWYVPVDIEITSQDADEIMSRIRRRLAKNHE